MSNFPYPGLRPFERDETDIFFGREEQTDQLLAQLGKTHFLAVVGPSGCGKSSLVRTGLLAGLESGFLTTAGSDWRIAEFRPGHEPLSRLTTALLEAIKPEYLKYLTDFIEDNSEITELLQTEKSYPLLLNHLKQGDYSLHELLNEIPLPVGTQLLLLVDQFEEIFRHVAGEAVALVALLLASSQHPEIYVVITMRSDFIGDCAQFYGLPEAINQGLFLTPRLTRAQLREAIELPAQVFGGRVAEDLVNRLLNDVGNDPDQLPILQHALMRMWHLASDQILTVAHYEQIGGLKAALSNHADEAFAELSGEQQRIAERLFRSLTERGQGRDTRRPVLLQEVAALAEVGWEDVAAVVEVFRQTGRSFLMPPVDKPLIADSMIDISHESLIRQWVRLQAWVKAEGESADMYRRLETTAQLWVAGKAELWQGLDLGNALVWREQVRPNAIWAKRYGVVGGFELAVRFLEASQQAQQREEQARVAQQQQEVKRLQKQVTFAVLAVAIWAGLATWGYFARQEAKKHQEIALQQKSLALQAINNLTYDKIDQLLAIPRTKGIMLPIFETNVEILEAIYALDPADNTAQREKSVNLNNLGDAWLVLGNTRKALEAYKQSLEIAKRLAVVNPDNTSAQQDLSLSYNNIGNVQLRLGNTNDAMRAYEQSLEIRKHLADNDQNNIQVQQDTSVSYNNLGEVRLRLGDTKAALIAYQQSLEISKRLADINPDNIKVQRDMSISYQYLGDVHLQLGNTQDGLTAYQQSLEIRKRLATIDPSNVEIKRDLSTSYNNLGDIWLQLGDTQAALTAYQQSLEIRKHLATADPDNTQVQQDVSFSYAKLGNVQSQLGNTQAALIAYQQSLKAGKHLATIDPNNAEAQRDMAASYSGLGNVQLQLGNTQAALTAYQESLEIRKRLATDDPNNAQVQRDVSFSYNNLGDVLLQRGDIRAALTTYQQSLEIRKQLAASDLNNIELQRDVSFSYAKLGNVQLQLGNTQAALIAYQQSLEIRKRLVDADPRNIQAQRDVSVSYGGLGNVQLQLGDAQAALTAYQQSLEIRKHLATIDPSNVQVQRDVAVSYNNLGDVQLQLGNIPAALTAYQQSLKISRHFADADPSNVQLQRDVSFSHAKLGNAHSQLGDTQATFIAYQQYSEISKRLADADPSNIQSQHEAIVAIDRWLEHAPDNIEALFQRAQLAAKLNRFDQFDQDLKRILQLNPDHSRALNSLGFALADREIKDRYPEAQTLLERALKLEPESPYFLDSMGWLLYRMGKHPEALEYLQRATTLIEKNNLVEENPAAVAETAAHLGEVLWTMGQKEQAKQVWDKALQQFPDDKKLQEMINNGSDSF